MVASDLLKVITVSSGKGGVGKTNVIANMAIALSKLGKKVVLLDADLGLGNLDVLLGISPKYNFGHVVRGEKTLSEIMVDGPGGIKIIPAASGVQELTNLSVDQKVGLFSQIENLKEKIDLLLIDTAAGISQNVLFFNIVASEIIIVATPEPTSIVDAYALMKVLHLKHGEKKFRLLVNQARSDEEAVEVYKNITLVADQYLNISVDYIGYIPYDDNLRKSVREQKPVIEYQPNCKASLSFAKIAKVVEAFPPATPDDNLHMFKAGGRGGSLEQKHA